MNSYSLEGVTDEDVHNARTVLVVDDNPANRAVAQAALEDEGYRVTLVESGEKALAAFQAERPDCVLLDIRMPGMDGFAVCTRIRALPEGGETPIIFLTALRDVDTFDAALRAGGDDFLTKPVRPTELAVRVQAALRLGRMSSELRENYEMIRRQRDDLMRLQLQKERLTSFVVHDLKNPVNSMDLHAQLLLRDPELPARARDSILAIRHEARSLLRLVLNLLDISKSEEGRLEPNTGEIDVAQLLRDVVEAHTVEAESAGVSLEHAAEVARMTADPDLIRRVLDNLVDNAVRHAPEHSAIRLRAATHGDLVELRVTDEGPGVPTELRDKIFERFMRLESGERVVTRSGRGLGLAFCRLAVEAHGGSIAVEDAQPGASFCVRIPAAPESGGRST